MEMSNCVGRIFQSPVYQNNKEAHVKKKCKAQSEVPFRTSLNPLPLSPDPHPRKRGENNPLINWDAS